MIVTSYGPRGAFGALANCDAELHGVRVRRVLSGREVSNEKGYGETSLTICYVDGRRSSRCKAVARLSQNIAEGERVEIVGPGRFT